MQEIHSIGGGRFFGGGGDRRLRPHHPHHQQSHQQALKCPRCDSLNTKFCYYNNYNLSQPRHFCKNCRRYWTKGGVLRNVPVGGGCRKSKRSNKPKNNSSSNNNNNSSSSSETIPATTPTPQPQPQPQPPEPERKSNSHSSSESSSLTAAAAAATTEAMSALTSNAASNKKLFLDNNIHESKLFTNPGLELEQGGGGVGGGDHFGIFSEIGSFTSLITSTNEALAFGFGNNMLDASSFRFSSNHQHGSDQLPLVAGTGQQHGQCHWQQQKVMGISSDHHEFAVGSLLDQPVPLELSSLQNNKTGHGGFGSLDWHAAGADQGLFDLPNTVDQAYWTHSHWSDQDNPTLFHLP